MADRTEGHRAANWSGTAGPYSRSFARLCAGTISPKIVTGQTPSLQATMKGHYGRLVSPLIHKGEVVLAAEALIAIGIREAFT